MGLRFKKSFKIAPGVKVNLNKKSASVTVGTKGAHYTVNSKGKKTASVGIPGTGVSYTTSSGGDGTKTTTRSSDSASNIPAPQRKNKKKKGCLTAIVVLLILSGIGSVMGEEKLKSVSLSANTVNVYDINTKIPISVTTDPTDYKIKEADYICSGGNFIIENGKYVFTASEAGEYTVSLVCEDNIKSNALTFKVEDKAAIKVEEEAAKKAEEERIAAEEAAKKAEEERLASEQAAASQTSSEQTNAQISQQPQEEMVWISQTGSKYHRNSSCSGMKDPKQVTLSEAEALNLEPCGKCY